MLTFSELYSFAELRGQTKKNTVIPTESGGVYKWWCNKEEFEYLLERLNFFNGATENTVVIDFASLEKYTETMESPFDNKRKLYCIYVGMTKASLYKRIKSQHLGGNPNGSTVRRSMWGLIKSFSGKYDNHNPAHREFNKKDINEFIDKLFIQFAECSQAAIDAEEKAEISKKYYIRILNIDDLSSEQEFKKAGGYYELRNVIKENNSYAKNH